SYSFHIFLLLHSTPPTELYTLSLHDALPIYSTRGARTAWASAIRVESWADRRSGGPADRRHTASRTSPTARLTVRPSAIIAPPSIVGFPGPGGPHRRGLPSRPPCPRSAPAAPRS